MRGATYTIKCLEDARELTEEELQQTFELLHALPPALQSILDAELKTGNKIADVSSDYPDKGSICVSLRSRFKSRHKSDGVVYSLTHDPHYWYAEYYTPDSPRHLLVCSW